MSALHATAARNIDAPASSVLAVLRDFDGHHRKILPAAFSNLVVEEGGHGAGTVISFDITLGGRTESARARVEEPGPGVIEEHLIGREMVTTFTVRQAGSAARTRIDTRWQPARGLAGLMERLFAPRMLRQIYRDELANLNDVAGSLRVPETGTVVR